MARELLEQGGVGHPPTLSGTSYGRNVRRKPTQRRSRKVGRKRR
jgi:hypothetical protein